MKTPKQDDLNAKTLNWDQYKSRKQENSEKVKDEEGEAQNDNDIIAEAVEEEK